MGWVPITPGSRYWNFKFGLFSSKNPLFDSYINWMRGGIANLFFNREFWAWKCISNELPRGSLIYNLEFRPTRCAPFSSRNLWRNLYFQYSLTICTTSYRRWKKNALDLNQINRRDIKNIGGTLLCGTNYERAQRCSNVLRDIMLISQKHLKNSNNVHYLCWEVQCCKKALYSYIVHSQAFDYNFSFMGNLSRNVK